MHRSLIMSAVLAVLVSAVSPAWPAGQLEMPYACRSSAGELSLTASPQQTYEIIGKREQRAYTACRDAGAPNCKTMMLHRFTISCDGVPVAWHSVVSKIRSDTIGPSWLEGDELNLVFRLGSSDKQRAARFVMPGGFAPVAEVGASLSRPAASGVTSAADADAADAAVAEMAARAVVDAEEAEVTLEVEASAGAIPAPVWQTVV